MFMEASELIKGIKKGRQHPKHPHIGVPMMERFKGETGERNNLILLANKSSSGLEI